jgi:hypothetical protein
MAVMARETWTDERLDDLTKRMDKGFDEVKGEVGELRKEMNSRFSSIDARFDAMQRTMIIGFASIAASVIGALLATSL